MTEPEITEAQRAEIRECVRVELLPYRVRFYVMLTMLVVIVVIAAFSYLRGQDDLRNAVNRISCSERALVIHATPTRPRAQTSGGKPLHYTKAQRAEIRAIRADLLSTLLPAHCPSTRSSE